nr:sm-like protein lsm7 [Quercus suber]
MDWHGDVEEETSGDVVEGGEDESCAEVEGVEDHGPAVLEVDLVVLELQLRRVFWGPAVDREGFERHGGACLLFDLQSFGLACVCRGTAVMLVSPTDGNDDEIANPFTQADGLQLMTSIVILQDDCFIK